MEDEYLKNFKDGVADALVRGVSNLEADWGKGYKKGYDFGMTVFSEQMEQEEPHEKVDILADRDQQAEDDYWDNYPEEAKRPPIDENLEKVILGAFKKVFPERFTPTDTSDVAVGVQLTEWAETPANALHYGNVDDLTIAEIMGMDNNFNLFKGKSDLIDKLRDYLLDNLAVRKHMGYDWSLDNE